MTVIILFDLYTKLERLKFLLMKKEFLEKDGDSLPPSEEFELRALISLPIKLGQAV